MDSAQATQPTVAGRVSGFVDRTRSFFAAVRTELGKVTWPARPELVKATRMIIVLSLVLGVLIGLLDWMLQKILVDGVAQLAR